MHDVQGGTVKGRVRPYSEAVRLGVIDAQIRDLVGAMNVRGVVETRSSCAGHRWTLLAALQAPFVMFKADSRYALRLAELIHKDWRARNSYLHYYWDIAGHFDDAGEFLFTLECRSRRFQRKRLNRDFQTLRSWAEEVFQAGEVSSQSRFDLSASSSPYTLAEVLSAGHGLSRTGQ